LPSCLGRSRKMLIRPCQYPVIEKISNILIALDTKKSPIAPNCSLLVRFGRVERSITFLGDQRLYRIGVRICLKLANFQLRDEFR